MPRDSLAFTIRVGCENDFARAFRERFDFADDFFFTLRNFIMWHEAGRDINRFFIALWQIANMSNGRLDGVVVPEIFRLFLFLPFPLQYSHSAQAKPV